MDDITDKLRKHDDPRLYLEADCLMSDAADEIDRLRARIAELESKLASRAVPDALSDLQILRIAADVMTAPVLAHWLKDDVRVSDVREAAINFARAVLAAAPQPDIAASAKSDRGGVSDAPADASTSTLPDWLTGPCICTRGLNSDCIIHGEPDIAASQEASGWNPSPELKEWISSQAINSQAIESKLAAPSAPAEVEGEREAFEEWYREHHGSRNIYELDATGEYRDKWVQGAFNVWKASRAQLGAVPADRLERIVPRIDPTGLSETEHCCEWALYQDRERIRRELRGTALTATGGRDELLRLRQALEQYADDGNWCYDTCNIGRQIAKDAIAALAAAQPAPQHTDKVGREEPALEWSPTLLDGKNATYEEAEAAIAELGDGWRLPTRFELESLLDLTRHDPAIDTDRFPDTKSTWYWTSTQTAWSAVAFWVVNFNNGNVNNNYRNNNACVRAVREAQPAQEKING